MSSVYKSDSNIGSLKLPPDEMPEDWEDDERMNFLFACFKSREINPISWDAKMNFWKHNIEKYCIFNNIICLDEAKMKKAFERKSKVPACLADVLEALKGEGKIKLRSEILKHGFKGQSWSAWTKEMVIAKPASFAMNRLWSALGYNAAQGNVGDCYVCVEALQNRAEAMLARRMGDPDCHHSSSPAIELPTLLREEGGEDARLALVWLCQHGKATVDEGVQPALVRFGHHVTISEVDRQGASLKRQEAALRRRMHDMEEEREKCTEEAKDYLKRNMRTAAKASLRKKRELERRIDKLAEAITNVHVLLSHVEDTESNAKVLESYRSAAAALKGIFKDTGLSEDGAAATMDEVEEALEQHEDVRTLISTPVVGGGPIVDESELENELADLLAEPEEGGAGDGGNVEPDISLPELPDVPVSPPASIIRGQLT
ncbi:hypothetical protein B566_EDAN011947 [Ephemera danica]|nr:hypothetical protein B566_EDAN011947 [Ephemera danica]